MAVIAVVIYGIGWGAILAIGFVFGAVDVMRSAGSAAARPAIVWTLVCIAAGQLAIADGAGPDAHPRAAGRQPERPGRARGGGHHPRAAVALHGPRDQ